MKAALLSALVFPGLGHFYLKQRIQGFLLAGTALAALYVIVSRAADQAMQLSDKILRGEVAPDVTSITEALASQPADGGSSLMTIAYAALVITWLIGIVDSYRSGRKPDEKRNAGRVK